MNNKIHKRRKSFTMKNLFQITFILSLFLPLTEISGQGGNLHNIRVLGQPDGNRIMLRWAPSDYETWKEGNTAGYTVERFTTALNGVDLGGMDAFNSKVVLANNLKPLSESQWNTQFPNNNFGELAKGTLYEEDATVQISGDPTLADAFNKTESEESRFLFALFAAEQDFGVAQGMALGFDDVSAEVGATYIYTVRLNSTEPEFEGVKGGISIEFDLTSNLPVVSDLKGEGMDHAAILEWNIEETSNFYSSYDIERSTDGTTFAKTNDLPFIFSSDGPEESSSHVLFRDSLDNNTTVYHYRVKGRTPFGLQGPASSVIQVKGTPPRVNLFLNINDHTADQGNVTLNWDSFDDSMEGEVREFNIYRSLYSNRAYEKINIEPLKPMERSFKDEDPIGVAYYQLEAVDHNGHFYSSPSALVQLPDSIPPAIPTGFAGTFITPTRVELTWDANTEEDLQGYRIVVANKLESQYSQITESPVVGENFVYEIEPRFIAENIYFKIMSTDNRDNFSDKSEPIEIERPDKIAPAKPNLYKASPAPEGIQIGFRFSESSDVEYHVLERKPANSPGWVQVLKISSEEEEQFQENLTADGVTSTCYIDETILERREYEYRFLAYDDHDNASSSEVVTIRPYDNGKRGTIDDIRAIAECIPLTGVDLPNKDAYELIDYLLLYYKETGDIEYGALEKLSYLNIITAAEYNDLIQLEPFEVNVFLTRKKMDLWGENIAAKTFIKWDYSSDDQLVDFQVFRSAEGSAMMLYKTLPIDGLTDYIFEDDDVRPGRRYFYQVMARHAGGGFSDRSETVMIKVPKS